MTITVGITHITHYKYDRPVALSAQSVRLRPSPHNKVPIKSYSFKIKPKDHFLNWYQDIFGNFVANVVFSEKITEFKIEVDLKAEINIINPFDFFIDKRYEKWPFEYDAVTKKELGNYLEITENGPLLNKWMENNVDRKKQTTLDLLVDINQKLNKSLGYIIRFDPGVRMPEDLLAKGSGSCRDFAWTLCQIYRHLGFASRYS
jgi:transglutaminase-like putative cysteine protease